MYKRQPPTLSVQAFEVFTGATVAFIHSSFAIKVVNALTFDHKLMSETLQIERT